MNQSISALGSVVRATRKSKNLSQEALAEKLGVCKRTIIDIEKIPETRSLNCYVC